MTPTLRKRLIYAGALLVTVILTVVITLLLLNIFERKSEERAAFVRVVEVGEDDTDPAKWGQNWPNQYDGYKRTALPTATRFGGHGGNEAMPAQKLERDPWLKRMFEGYAFSIDYRDRRGHAYMLTDQEATKRLSKPQSGSCLHCHASVMPLYRSLGDGDAQKGFEASHRYTYDELNKQLHGSGHGHPVSCVDCHDPKTMSLRVTRPGFLTGIAALASSEAEVPALPSLQEWRAGKRDRPYDPNRDATRNEMRSFVCGQCHVEYYCSTKMPLTFPWAKGLKVEQIESYWNDTKFPDGSPFSDYEHAETGARILKAQHPEFELWNQGVHSRAGVSCADCHMPYMRTGATKVSDHWVRSPLLNIARACQTCHRAGEGEIRARVDGIQQRNHDLMQRAGAAVVDLIDAVRLAKSRGATQDQLAPALALQRSAQWRLDFIAAENSMGFHAPHEAARILAEAIDLARQGQLAVVSSVPSPAPPPAPPAGSAPAGSDAGSGAPAAGSGSGTRTGSAGSAAPPAGGSGTRAGSGATPATR